MYECTRCWISTRSSFHSLADLISSLKLVAPPWRCFSAAHVRCLLGILLLCGYNHPRRRQGNPSTCLRLCSCVRLIFIQDRKPTVASPNQVGRAAWGLLPPPLEPDMPALAVHGYFAASSRSVHGINAPGQLLGIAQSLLDSRPAASRTCDTFRSCNRVIATTGRVGWEWYQQNPPKLHVCILLKTRRQTKPTGLAVLARSLARDHKEGAPAKPRKGIETAI